MLTSLEILILVTGNCWCAGRRIAPALPTSHSWKCRSKVALRTCHPVKLQQRHGSKSAVVGMLDSYWFFFSGKSGKKMQRYFHENRKSVYTPDTVHNKWSDPYVCLIPTVPQQKRPAPSFPWWQSWPIDLTHGRFAAGDTVIHSV